MAELNHDTVLVTGGAGFIGSAVIRHLLANETCRVVNVDKLTYAGNVATIADFDQDPRYTFCLLYTSDAADD